MRSREPCRSRPPGSAAARHAGKGLRGRKRLLGALLLVTLLAPLGQAQEPPPEHQVTIIESSFSLVQEPSVELVREVDNTVGRSQACTDDNTITVDPGARSFTFNETFSDVDCTEAQLTLLVPAGATLLQVDFTANRSITQFRPPGLQGLPVVPNMVQQFSLYGPNGTAGRADYFQKQDAPSDPRPFTFQYAIPVATAAVTLGWYFADEGATAPTGNQLQAGQRFNVTVGDITVGWPALPVPDPTIVVGPETIREEDRLAVAHTYVNITLPELGVGIAGRTSGLRLVVAAGPDLVGVQGPGGPIDPEDVEQAEARRRLELDVNGTVLAQQGLGTYSFEFLTARALPPLPPVSPPTRVYQFFLVMLLLPIPAAVLATYSSNAYRREAEGPYVRTARIVLGLVVAIIVYYVVIAFFALFVIGPRTMAVLPPTDAVLLTYGQLLLVLILLVGIAVLQARARTGAMRRDIEERRRKEDRLRRSNEELERFAYVASHDLQEPLRKVAGFTALLQKRYGGRLDKDADEIIQYAVDGASRMQMLIKDILAYSRVGSKELERVPVDTDEMMKVIVADLSEPVKQTGAEVRWNHLPTVRADASQMRQVLQNLVENAIKYRHPKRRPKVQVAATREPEAWHFTVRDNGQGIPADKSDEIFGIFRRLHGQSTPGTGIGLAVAKKAIERHDGKIWVESTPGRGSTFHFTLPHSLLGESGPAPAPAPAPRPAPEGSSAGAAL